ncbi:MAG: imidazoleglycerol-phosphate dehydratase HisB [Anaerolineales bacterium]|nr:imidazoleglycerol-phosphate dehydratase HisB [Anaerolineales bacterium]
MRTTRIQQQTSETDILAELNLDGSGKTEISTGIGFLDHMLHHLAFHGMLDLTLKATGDLDVDAHHTIEDCALVLGEAFNKALKDRAGIVRVGSAFVPMDEALAEVVLDFSGRPYCVMDAEFNAPMLGAFPTDMIEHFFQSLAATARLTIHARVLYGRNDHHKAEALFKALGRAIRQAVELDKRRGQAIPSTKGVL